MSANTKKLGPFDLFLILGVLICSVSYSVLDAAQGMPFDWLGLVAAVTGLLCVVLAAHGNILNYAFGIINVTTYAYISFTSNLLGDFALNLFYYLPLQFIGFAVWRKRSEGEGKSQLVARRMSPKQLAVVSAVSLAIVLTMGWLLSVMKGYATEGSFIERYHLYSEYPYKDALTTVFAITGQFLMARAFAEQWYFWIVMDVVSVIIWAMFWASGTPHAALMTIMYVFYTINAINGLVIWLKMPTDRSSVSAES